MDGSEANDEENQKRLGMERVAACVEHLLE
jgi:hypothetical protein